MKHQIIGFLYRTVLKPLCFSVDAEMIHNHATLIGSWLGAHAIGRHLIHSLFYVGDPSLHRTIDGIVFPNPVGLAAGFDYEARLPAILPDVGFGFMTVGTVTLHQYEGNSPPRLQRLPHSRSLIINKGFKSPGAAAIIKKMSGQKFAIPVGISIGSTNSIHHSLDAQIADVYDCFHLFERSRVQHTYYELNVSCPNTKGGQPFTTPSRLERLLKRLGTLHTKRPIYIKMPIDFSGPQTLALLHVAARHRFISGVIFGNLTKDKTNPAVTEGDRQIWLTVQGNLSGKPTWDRSNKLIALTKKHFRHRFTIIGTGGIFSPEDARTKLRLGADLVQLITGMIYEGPQLIGEITTNLLQQPIS